MKAFIRTDDTGEITDPCVSCKHSYWCELCEDWHCELFINLGLDAECEYEGETE